MAKKALINYYARLIQKGYYTEDELPADVKEAVLKRVKELPPLKTEDGTSEEDKKSEEPKSSGETKTTEESKSEE